MLNLRDRYQGCLLGLAVGDAVGTTLEFKPRGSFSPIDDMGGGGPFNLLPGQWTDDTSMALCLAYSLVNKRGFHAEDQMNRYCNWREHGYMSSTGHCFDIGFTVSGALNRYLESGNPFSGSTETSSSGNGSLMRLAPVAMAYAPNRDDLLKYARESSRTTHGSAECIDACCYFACLLNLAFTGAGKAEILSSARYQPITPKVDAIIKEPFRDKRIDDIQGTGYVIDSLEAALWCFTNTDTFDSAVLAAANLGDDADTTAAICGQLAGAFYGVSGIRDSWLEQLYLREQIENIATELLLLANELSG